jgi:hypothetical protein
MTDITISVNLKLPGGQPATGLTLTDISIWLTAQNRATGADTVIWDGTQNPTDEMANTGDYIRIYSGADLDTYNYYGVAQYTGVTALERTWIHGAIGIDMIPLGTAQEFTYTVVEEGTGNPIEGVFVEIHRNAAGTDQYWDGVTDAFGVARDEFGNKPRLDPGTWYFWRRRGGYSFDNPDTEVVT